MQYHEYLSKIAGYVYVRVLYKAGQYLVPKINGEGGSTQ